MFVMKGLERSHVFYQIVLVINVFVLLYSVDVVSIPLSALKYYKKIYMKYIDMKIDEAS